MQKIAVVGGAQLAGEVRISGAKNAVLPILCATLLADAPVRITNVPYLHDVLTTTKLLAGLGAKVSHTDDVVEVDAQKLSSRLEPYDLVKTMRASVLVLGPLLAKYGDAEVSLPGGCAIGSRPVDLHIKGLQALGADAFLDPAHAAAAVAAEVHVDAALLGSRADAVRFCQNPDDPAHPLNRGWRAEVAGKLARNALKPEGNLL